MQRLESERNRITLKNCVGNWMDLGIYVSQKAIEETANDIIHYIEQKEN